MLHRQYTHLDCEDRREICWGLKHGWSVRRIALDIGRNPATVSREIRRNRSPSGCYSAQVAHVAARNRREEKPKRICLKNENVRRYVEEGLRRGWSPEQIAGRLPIDCPGETTNSESIYTYIYNKRRDLTKFLTYGRAKRRKRAHAHAQRIVHANRRSIDERPPEVLDRRRHGHWEFDTAHGAHTEALAVSTERTTGFVQITPIERKTAAAMYHAIVSQFREIDRSLMRSLTCDNGSENAAHQRILRDRRSPGLLLSSLPQLGERIGRERHRIDQTRPPQENRLLLPYSSFSITIRRYPERSPQEALRVSYPTRDDGRGCRQGRTRRRCCTTTLNSGARSLLRQHSVTHGRILETRTHCRTGRSPISDLFLSTGRTSTTNVAPTRHSGI